ncbi:MAG: YceI family protein [Pseudomonadota bacterium]
MTPLKAWRWWMLGVGSGLAWAACAQPTDPGLTANPAPGYRLDPTHTFVHWEVLHMDTSTIRGRFDRLQGQVVFDAAARRLEVGISVDMKSVSTGSAAFDAVLRGSTLLATEAHPQAYFTARQAEWDGEAPRAVKGEITLRGISQPLTLQVVRWKCGFNPLFRARVCGGDLEATLKRTDFELHFGTPLVANEVQLRIQVEALPQTSDKAADAAAR